MNAVTLQEQNDTQKTFNNIDLLEAIVITNLHNQGSESLRNNTSESLRNNTKESPNFKTHALIEIFNALSSKVYNHSDRESLVKEIGKAQDSEVESNRDLKLSAMITNIEEFMKKNHQYLISKNTSSTDIYLSELSKAKLPTLQGNELPSENDKLTEVGVIKEILTPLVLKKLNFSEYTWERAENARRLGIDYNSFNWELSASLSQELILKSVGESNLTNDLKEIIISGLNATEEERSDYVKQLIYRINKEIKANLTKESFL
jgi:hypothetical protein